MFAGYNTDQLIFPKYHSFCESAYSIMERRMFVILFT